VLIEPLVNGFAASLFPAFRPVFPSKKMKYQGPGLLALEGNVPEAGR